MDGYRGLVPVPDDDDDLEYQVDSAVAISDDLDSTLDTHSDRHGSLSMLCGKFHAILAGRAAEELLAAADEIPDLCAVWVGPSWAWLFSRVNVGRKDRASDGSRLRLPVRVEWSTGPVAILEPGTVVDQYWTAAGMGHTGHGVVPTELNASLLTDRVELNEAGVPLTASLALVTKDEAIRVLHGLVEDGAKARWEALLWLEPYIERALRLAHASVANELSVQWGTHRVLLDETKLKTIADQMLLGDEDHPGKVAQMLERCLKPKTFEKVEPVKYIKETLRRDANTEVRRAIGDPHIGAKIRKVAQELGTGASLETIIATYRERYPNDRLSKDRAEAALSVAPDAMASWWGLHPDSDEVVA